MHAPVTVDTTSEKKSEAVAFYNKTKCGLDIADQFKAIHGQSRKQTHGGGQWQFFVMF